MSEKDPHFTTQKSGCVQKLSIDCRAEIFTAGGALVLVRGLGHSSVQKKMCFVCDF